MIHKRKINNYNYWKKVSLFNNYKVKSIARGNFETGFVDGLVTAEDKIILDIEEFWKEAIINGWVFNWHTFEKLMMRVRTNKRSEK